MFTEVVKINGVESVTETALRALRDKPRQSRTPAKTSTLIITGVKRVSFLELFLSSRRGETVKTGVWNSLKIHLPFPEVCFKLVYQFVLIQKSSKTMIMIDNIEDFYDYSIFCISFRNLTVKLHILQFRNDWPSMQNTKRFVLLEF